MFDFTQLLSLLGSPPVTSFIATYAATKGLDELLNAVKSQDTIAYQLLTCLEKALRKTCNHFDWEYDSTAIPETFLPHWRSIKTIDTTESLSSVIENAVGRHVSLEVLEYWAHSFYNAVSDSQFEHLYKYLVINKLSDNEPPTPKPLPDTHRYITLAAPPTNKEFSYRDEMVEDLYKTIHQNKKLALISGLGGIGKTTIAKALYHKVKNEFKHIAWVEYQHSIKDSLLSSFTLFNDIKDSADRYRRITNFLLGATKDTIIFIDNVSDNDYEGVSFIEQLPVNVVLTSRSSKIGNFTPFTVGFLSEKQCVEIFYKYYEYDTARERESIVSKLVQLVKCHTLSVELLARAANRPGYSLEKYAAELKEKGFEYPDFSVRTNHTANTKTIAEHLRTLFELVTVNDEQQRILKNFAVMPSVEIPAEVEAWLGCAVDDIMGLTELGWLAVSETGYEMHPIIKEAILLQYNSVEYEDFEAIVKYMSGDDYINDAEIYTKVRARLSIVEPIMSCLGNIENEDIGLLFNNIAIVYSRQGDYHKALEWHQKTLEICKKVLGLEHPSTATTYNNIAEVYVRQGDYHEALEWHQKALQIREKVLGLEHPNTATTYNNIASVFNSQGDYPKALEWYLKALKICEKVLGLEHQDTAATYNNIALVFDNQGDYPKALEWYQKALEIREEVLGLEHPDTATTYNNIASVFNSQGDYPEALEWHQKAMVIKEKILGIEHPSTATTYHNIALVHTHQGDYPKALEWNQKALKICEKVLGIEHLDTASTYNNIAGVFASQGDYSKALEWNQKALKIREKVLGLEHPDTATTYNNIAGVFVRQGDYHKALEWFQKALQICEKVLGLEHPNTVAIKENIAFVKVLLN